MVGVGILTLLSLLLIVLSGQYLGKTVFIASCHAVARVTYLVAPTVFDTVESYRKCRRPVGAGMMYLLVQNFLLSSKLGSQSGTVCSLEEQKSVCIHCSDTEEYEFSGTWLQCKEGGLERDND